MSEGAGEQPQNAESMTSVESADSADSAESATSATSTTSVTVLVLTEEALKPADVDKIVSLHQEEGATYRVLVPADTERNMLSSFLNHLSLLEMREALESLRPVDRESAHADANEALSRSLAAFAERGAVATGEITADDPMPTLIEEVGRLAAREVVVVTEPHAVEDTFHIDWASKAREKLGLPVLHMYAGDWRLG